MSIQILIFKYLTIEIEYINTSIDILLKTKQALSIPLIWFTLNPKDIGNIFVVKLAAEEVSLDGTGVKSVLLQMTLKNPSLVAQYFHVIVTAFFDSFFKTLSKEPGIFGTVTSHFGVVESTTRMMLHLHGFAWLAGNFGAQALGCSDGSSAADVQGPLQLG
jgi:hypothetical protein